VREDPLLLLLRRGGSSGSPRPRSPPAAPGGGDGQGRAPDAARRAAGRPGRSGGPLPPVPGRVPGAQETPSAAVHDRWTERVLSTDFADAAAHYGSIPRGALWVATASLAEFASRSGGLLSTRGCASGPPPLPLLALLLLARTRAASSSSGGGGPDEVLVGCVACVPWREAPAILPLQCRRRCHRGGAAAASQSGGPPSIMGPLSCSPAAEGPASCCASARTRPCGGPVWALRSSPSWSRGARGKGEDLRGHLVEHRCAVHVVWVGRRHDKAVSIGEPFMPPCPCSGARLGYTQVQLSTLSTQESAVRIYAARGYTQVREGMTGLKVAR